MNTKKQTTRVVKRRQKSAVRDSEFTAWTRHHMLSAQDSAQRLFIEPLSSLLTWMVIGIALALPAILYTALSNIETVSQQWDNGTRISLFLDKSISQEQGETVAKKILK